MDSLITVVCKEPHGTVARQVKQFLPDPISALRIYDAMKTCPAMMPTGASSLELLIKDWWKFYTVDDVGMLAFDPFKPGVAHVHVTFWDKRLRGREELCRQTALLLMQRSSVEQVITAIPLDFRPIRAFAKRVGFQHLKDHNGREILVANQGCFTAKQPGVA